MMGFGSAVAMGLLGAASGAGEAISSNAEANLENRRLVERETQRQRAQLQLEEQKLRLIKEAKQRDDAEKSEKISRAMKPRSQYDYDGKDMAPIPGDEGLMNRGFEDLSTTEKVRAFADAGLPDQALGLLTTATETDEEIRKDEAVQKTKQHTPVAVGNGGAVFANGQMIPNTNQAVSVVRQSSTGGSGGGASSGNAPKGAKQVPGGYYLERKVPNQIRDKRGKAIGGETLTKQEYYTNDGRGPFTRAEWMKMRGGEGKPSQAPASPGKNSGGTIKAPYPDGTRLRGKDGKYYVVKNGKPVLE